MRRLLLLGSDQSGPVAPGPPVPTDRCQAAASAAWLSCWCCRSANGPVPDDDAYAYAGASCPGPGGRHHMHCLSPNRPAASWSPAMTGW